MLNSELHDLEIKLGLGSDVKSKYDATKAVIENNNYIKPRDIFVHSKASWVEDNENIQSSSCNWKNKITTQNISNHLKMKVAMKILILHNSDNKAAIILL